MIWLALATVAHANSLSLAPFSTCGDVGRWSWAAANSERLLTKIAGDALDVKPLDFAETVAGGSYSKTLVQEAGVSEADRVATDGRYIYAVTETGIAISTVPSLGDADVVSHIDIAGVPDGLFLRGDTLVVASRTKQGAVTRTGGSLPWKRDSTTITVIDVTTRNAPMILRETYASGALSDARAVGDQLVLVTESQPSFSDAPELAKWRKNSGAIDPTPWLPRQLSVAPTQGGTSRPNTDKPASDADWRVVVDVAMDCTDIFTAPDAVEDTKMSTVYTLDLNNPTAEFRGIAVTGNPDIVYTTTSGVWLGHRNSDVMIADIGATILHHVAVGEAGPVYDASGSIDGQVPGRLALSEVDGVLRVANFDPKTQSSGIVTLDVKDGNLRKLGEITGLGVGEILFAARWDGFRGYVVTAVDLLRPKDPLYTLDVADPKNPKVLGELHIDGWSDLLVPIDHQRLLAVGMMNDANNNLVPQVSLFDMSDGANPRLVSREILPERISKTQNVQERGGLIAATSAARTDLHAWTWLPERHLLALPVSGPGGAGFAMYRVGDSLADLGFFSLSKRAPQAERAVFVDDAIWAVGPAGMIGTAWSAPNSRQRVVSFTESEM